MATTVIKRKSCRLCESTNVEMVVSLAPVPLAEKYTASEAEKNTSVYPIDLYMCNSCGHVQLLDVIDSDTLWDDYTYHSAQTKGIVEHFREVCDSVTSKRKPEPRSLVIDIGSNDGSLLRPFQEKGHKVLGVDPAKEIARKATASGIETIPDVLTLPLAKEIRAKHGPASVITAFNVFAHADNMGEMADAIAHMLAPDGIFVFEVQYLVDIIDKMLLGTIFHEHMSHHSLIPMSKFLGAHGMELIDVERNSIQHGSIVGTAQLRGGQRKAEPVVAEMLAEERRRNLDKPEAMRGFVDRLEASRRKFAELMDEWGKSGATVAGYGAARSGPTLIANFGVGKAIQYIFDDHPQKVGKFTPGDHIQVLPTEELYKRKPDYTIILAWIHGKKIIANNQKYLDEGGHFVLCYPDVQVVGANDEVRI